VVITSHPNYQVVSLLPRFLEVVQVSYVEGVEYPVGEYDLQSTAFEKPIALKALHTAP
jgi:hypothetical protein